MPVQSLFLPSRLTQPTKSLSCCAFRLTKGELPERGGSDAQAVKNGLSATEGAAGVRLRPAWWRDLLLAGTQGLSDQYPLARRGHYGPQLSLAVILALPNSALKTLLVRAGSG